MERSGTDAVRSFRIPYGIMQERNAPSTLRSGGNPATYPVPLAFASAKVQELGRSGPEAISIIIYTHDGNLVYTHYGNLV